jgi:hypothetical protein
MSERKVTLENDYRINQSYFRDWETNRAIRIDSILSTQQAWKIAAEKGWRIVMWTTVEYTQPEKKASLLDRAFSFLRRNANH